MKKSTAYSQCFIHCLIMICGIIGVVGGLLKALKFPIEAYICLPILFVISMFFYYLDHQKNRKIGIITVVTEVILAIYLMILRGFDMHTLGIQFNYIIKYDYYLEIDQLFFNSAIFDVLFIWSFVIFIGLPLVYLIVSILIKRRFVLIKLIILMLIFIFPIIIKHPLSNIAGYAFAVFLIYSLIFSFLINRQSDQIIHQIIITIIIVITLLFSSIFFEANPIFKNNSLDVIFNISSWIEENQLNQWFNTQNSTGVSASINGALPNGNVSIDGKVALKVKSDKPFSSYLRSYSLGYYTNNRWQPVINEFKGNKNNGLLSFDIKSESENCASVIIGVERQTKYQIVPYYPLFADQMIDDSYYQNSESPIDVNYSKSFIFKYLNTNHCEDTEYYQYVLDEYMNVPAVLKPKFKQAFENQQAWQDVDLIKTSIAERITFVNQFLNQYTNYDLNAGNLPAGKDFVDYFLFENQKGSCTHYATAATLLLRYLGIPSRYVSGFVITTKDFDKNNEAIIKNNRAHAWVEIYLQGIGWIPYDFTKSVDAYGSTTETSMANQLDQLLKHQDDKQLDPMIPEPKPSNPLTNEPFQEKIPDNNLIEEKVPWYEGVIQYNQYLYIVVGSIFIFLVYRYGQKIYLLLKIKKAKNNKKAILIYQRMILIDKGEEHINQSVMDIAYKAKFSQHLIDNNEVKMMEKELQLLQIRMYHLLPWYKKILYKYILGYM